jgi:hypothetical protein
MLFNDVGCWDLLRRVDPLENTQKLYEISWALLSACAVAKDVEVTRDYYGRLGGYDLNPHS